MRIDARPVVIFTAFSMVALAGCASHHTEDGSRALTAEHTPTATKVSADEAKSRLVAGNTRFVAGKAEHPRQGPERRTELARTQHPFAIIVGCADSRTSPEVVFDQGIGDLFVVRDAGNVIDDHAIGSIEYAAEHLGAELVVVVGHQRCGAVVAARDVYAAGSHADGHIESIVQAIRPAVQQTIGEDVEATCKANVRNVVHELRTSEPTLEHLVQTGKLTIIGAYYNFDTGVVEYLAE